MGRPADFSVARSGCPAVEHGREESIGAVAVRPQAQVIPIRGQRHVPAGQDLRDRHDLELRVGRQEGLHTGVATKAHERKKRERLCRYVARPAISEKRLSLTPNDNVRYDVKGFTNVAGAWMRRSDQLKTPCQDGATHVLFEPLDFIARLASLIPIPRVHLTRFHGVFA